MKQNVLLIGSLFLAVLTSATFGKNAEMSQDKRDVAAHEVLSKTKQSIALYVKGLCCPSCAIGIRKKVSRLDFVDTLRLKSGVGLDTKTQLATVAIKEKKKVNLFALAQAIRDAGYTPFHLYRMKNGEVETTVIPAKEE